MSAFARSYARAALESAPEGYDFENLLQDLWSVVRAIDANPRVREFFAAPRIPRPPKEKALEAIAAAVGLDDFGRRFLHLVLIRGRLPKLREIAEALSDAFDRSRGRNEAHVTVAAPIAADQESRIADALGRAFGGSFRVKVNVDEKILGGFIARVRSRLIDASVAGAIARFQKEGEEIART